MNYLNFNFTLNKFQIKILCKAEDIKRDGAKKINISFNLLKKHHLFSTDNIMFCYIFKSLYCLLASNLIY